MLGIPDDAAWIWLGLTAVSAAMFGVVSGVHPAPPAADDAAETVDEVAAGAHAAAAEMELDATLVKLGSNRVGLRGRGGTAHASFAFGPVAPVRPQSDLSRVLDGRSPQSVFESPAAFQRALRDARERPATWRPAGPHLRVRRVSYGEVNGVLVGA